MYRIAEALLVKEKCVIENAHEIIQLTLKTNGEGLFIWQSLGYYEQTVQIKIFN